MSQRQRIRKAVIPAAGLGTRLLPASKSVPKEMLPVVDKPVIQYVAEEAAASGVELIVIVTSASKRAIEDHFDRFYELEQRLESAGKRSELEAVRRPAELAKFAFVRQPEPLGNGHAVLMAREVIGDEPFAMLWGDDLVVADPPCLRQLINAYERTGGSVAAVMPVQRQDVCRYAVIAGREIDRGLYRVDDIVEKPSPDQAPSNLAAVKGYVLTPDVFDILARTPPGQGGEIWLADALRVQAGSGRLFAWEFQGKRYDVGNKLEYLEANVELALQRPDIGREFATYLRQLCESRLGDERSP